MAPVSPSTHREGLKAARLMMVLGGISPLFILWAIRGNSLIPDRYFIGFCGLMVLVPNTFLWLRIRIARKQNDNRELTAGKADDHRDHILVYLFAILPPLYSENLASWRYLGSSVAALAFIVFLASELALHEPDLRGVWLPDLHDLSAKRREPSHRQD